jgi:hypothetical protein
MIDAVAVCQVEIVDRDELDTDIVQPPVRYPASIDIEITTLPALDSLGRIQGEIAPVCCPAFFHDDTFVFRLPTLRFRCAGDSSYSKHSLSG